LFEKGKTYRITAGKFKDQEYVLEGLWIELTGKSWGESDGNPAALEYAIRTGAEGDTNYDDDVYYGKIGMFGKLIHASQIGEEIKKDES
jgi:hypothetical protein